uniref:SRCR domain-containing protein n=1 Tax=Periophthalmus magnuspinnatus TaxID=409849 RepID=A0A3B3ZWZ9_9GOBI
MIVFSDIACSRVFLLELVIARISLPHCRTSAYLLCTINFTDEIRLVGPGSSPCSGRVEIYHNRTWGTVCDNGWDMSDAKVVCTQVNCGVALSASQGSTFGQGSGQIWLDDVSCSGSESSLTQCGHGGFGSHNCGHGEDAGVICSGSNFVLHYL